MIAKPFSFLGMESDFGLIPVQVVALVLPLILRLILDYVTIVKRGKEVNHVLHTLYTGVVMLLTAITLADDWSMYFRALLFQACVFWLLFDYVLNILRGLKWYYIDLGLDGKRSKFDAIYERLGILGTLFLKVWMVFASFSLYFYMSYVTG